MRILLLGNSGQLGWELQRALPCLGEVTALDYPEVDFSQPDSLRGVVAWADPSVVINAVAYTAVDRAEQEPWLAQAVNATAPGVLAQECAVRKAVFIHYSTDYVFDGLKDAPYTEDDQPHPRGVYSQSKWAGEQAVLAVDCAALVLRTSWLYSCRRDNFVLKVLQWARKNPMVRIAADQYGSPTWARLLAEITAQMLAGSTAWPDYFQQRRGIYHLAGEGSASRYEWAEEILKLDPRKEEWLMQQLQPAAAADFPATAPRPMNSALNCDRFAKTFGLRLPAWREGLKLMMAQG
ncbi:MAG TPA: dTDP-4-dehydrorhamnose reductase [Anaerolineaceae bacterium]|nr:dTDP-4-dehydrorhamnose reductase [Anaerolineaceae bacterium]